MHYQFYKNTPLGGIKENLRMNKAKPKFADQKVDLSKKDRQMLFRGGLTVAETSSRLDHQELGSKNLTNARSFKRLDPQPTTSEYSCVVKLSEKYPQQLVVGDRSSKRLDPQPLKSESSSDIKLFTKYHQHLVAGDLTKEEALEWNTRWREVATS